MQRSHRIFDCSKLSVWIEWDHRIQCINETAALKYMDRQAMILTRGSRFGGLILEDMSLLTLLRGILGQIGTS